MAADLAAYFSDWKRANTDVEVYFTDSRRVAKRGTRVGQMKDSKRLGVIWASPYTVNDVVRDVQDEQGWL